MAVGLKLEPSAKGNWIEIPSLAIAPPYTKTYNDGGAPDWWSAPQSASIPALELLPGEYLIVRFADLKTSSSGGVGITQFRLSSELKPLTSCIIFR